jgi:hypothetical protein
MGLTIRAVYARHQVRQRMSGQGTVCTWPDGFNAPQDFCMANTPNNFLRVTVTDTHCFNGTKAELSPERSYVYGRGTSGVAPAGKFASYTLSSLGGVTHLVRKPDAGQQMPVHVQAIDIHGQPMTAGGEQFTMHVDGMPHLFSSPTSLLSRDLLTQTDRPLCG